LNQVNRSRRSNKDSYTISLTRSAWCAAWDDAQDDQALLIFQLVLTLAGLVPGLGEVFDAADATISLANGDKQAAATSAASMVPFAGWGAGGARLSKLLATGSSTSGCAASPRRCAR
jgi:hypothetical protein